MFIVLAACETTPEESRVRVWVAATPEVATEPDELEFGDVVAGESVTRTLAVKNRGGPDLSFTARIEDPEMPFVLGDVDAGVVPAGEAIELSVVYTPVTAREDVTRVVLVTNDPDDVEFHVDLQGLGIAPQVRVYPGITDLDPQGVGCVAVLPLTIYNDGNADLTVDRFVLEPSSPDFSVEHDPLPWTIEPGDSLEARVRYEPSDEGPDFLEVQAHSDDPYRGIDVVRVNGTGDASLACDD